MPLAAIHNQDYADLPPDPSLFIRDWTFHMSGHDFGIVQLLPGSSIVILGPVHQTVPLGAVPLAWSVAGMSVLLVLGAVVLRRRWRRGVLK